MKLTRRIDSDATFALALTGIFGIILAVGLWRHELWRDEYHAWMLALHSNSLSQLLGNLRGEGHLPLSYLLLYGIACCTANPLAIQVEQWIIATVSVFLLLRFAPFERLQKVLFIFGYFPLYEYGVISRSYSLDVLGLLGFCAVFSWAKQQQRQPWPAWIFILVLALNEPPGALLALPLTGLLIANSFSRKKPSPAQIAGMGGGLAAVAVLLGFILLRTVSLRQWISLFLYRMPHHLKDDFRVTFNLIGRAIIPRVHLPNTIWDIPHLKAQLLATHGVLEWLVALMAVLAVVLLLYCICRIVIASLRLPFNLYDRPPLFAVWATGTGLLFLMLWVSGLDAARHTGHFYLFFIACWWLAADFPQRPAAAAPRWLQYAQRHARRDFYFLLAFQLFLGVFAYSVDFFYLFSANQATASYIREHHLEGAALVAPEAVAGALGRAAYFPNVDMENTFIPMSAYRRATYLPNFSDPRLMQRTEQFITLHNAREDVVVITKRNAGALQKYFLWRSPPVIVEDEQYSLYLVPRGRWHASETK